MAHIAVFRVFQNKAWKHRWRRCRWRTDTEESEPKVTAIGIGLSNAMRYANWKDARCSFQLQSRCFKMNHALQLTSQGRNPAFRHPNVGVLDPPSPGVQNGRVRVPTDGSVRRSRDWGISAALSGRQTSLDKELRKWLLTCRVQSSLSDPNIIRCFKAIQFRILRTEKKYEDGRHGMKWCISNLCGRIECDLLIITDPL